MQRRNDPTEPIKVWFKVLKYPAEGLCWWIFRLGSYLNVHAWSLICRLSAFLCPVVKTIAYFLLKIYYLILGKLYVVRSWCPILSLARLKATFVPLLPTLAVKSWSFGGKDRLVPMGVLYMVDSAKNKIKLGVVYTSERIKSASRTLREKSHVLAFKADTAAYFLREKTGQSLGRIGEYFQHLVLGIGNSFIEVKVQASQGMDRVFGSTKGIFNIAVQSINDVFQVVYFTVTGFFYAMYLAFVSIRLSTFLYLGLIFGFLLYFLYEMMSRYKGAKYHKSLPIRDKIREGCKQFMLENGTLKEIMNKLLEQITLGLNHKTRAKSSVKCFNTYVQDLPNGKEKGKFLALDLGGTNFRILLIKLDGRHYEMQSKIYAVPASIMTGPGVDLFDHIASCLDNFTKEHKVANETLPLGFTFSFPVKQEGLKKGVLISWTKGFSCEGVVGQDVVEMLKVACERKMKTRISIVALLNDTTGTLMSCAWKNHNCKIGLILGTGTNACYMEKIENIEEFDGDHTKPYVLINTEWGAFGDNGELEFITTSFDKEIDQKSVNPGKQRHEKMISGMYLGELVRLLILKFSQDKILFDGKTSELLKIRDNFRTEYVSSIESDKRGSFKNCRNVLEKLGIHDVSDQDCANVRYICECVTRRAAHLASAGLATLINKMNVDTVTVGVDGTLYRKHPYFHDLMIDKILDLISPNVKGVHLMLSTDGSGRGAALIAAAAAGKEHTRR